MMFDFLHMHQWSLFPSNQSEFKSGAPKDYLLALKHSNDLADRKAAILELM